MAFTKFLCIIQKSITNSFNVVRQQIKRTLIFSVILFAVIQPSAQAVEITVYQESGSKTYSGALKSIGSQYIENNYRISNALKFTTTYLRSEFDSKYYISTFGSDSGGYVGLQAETLAFNGANYLDNNTISNGIVTHSGTVNAENGFWLESGFNPQWSYGDPNANLGSAIVTISQDVKHYYDADESSWLYRAADFFTDVYNGGNIINAITGKTRAFLRSQHILNEKGKKLFLKKSTIGGRNHRGSINTNGTSIYTASPGILSYDITFGEDGTLSLPFAFGENKDDATLEVIFNDELLGTVFGADYELDELSFLDLDITNYAGMSGSLDFVLNTTGTESANIFIPESISSVPVPAAVWLFGSGLIGLVGLARRKKA